MCAYPLVLATRKATVRGIYSSEGADKPFVGTIVLELRKGADERDKSEKWIYYSGGLILRPASLSGPPVIECRFG
jgi:hypothetical protein